MYLIAALPQVLRRQPPHYSFPVRDLFLRQSLKAGSKLALTLS